MTIMININNINLNSPEWTDLIFKGKNKEYGAYELHKNSSRRHIRALIVVTIGAILVMTIPALIKSVIPQHTKEQVLETYEVLKKNQYGKYLKDVLDGKYVDKLHNREF